MDHYVDIRLLPDAEFAPAMLMAALFTKLHKALAAGSHQDTGVSFPQMDVGDASPARASRTGAHPRYALGQVLRLHGTTVALHKLLNTDWLNGMRDHVVCSAVLQVPPDPRHRVVSRVQAKSSPERLRRRQMRRHGLTEEQAKERIPDSAAETLNLPFLTLRSQSTGQTFRLFIRLGPEQDTAVPGDFGSYGLSPRTTVPWF
ncbi:MAG: type I-F CRISPR-associated endoribonuclease Cas6/Csy4 [Limnohabitans sp.]